ncbi:MAG: 16S rRNA processing protein RimM [Ignavibacteriae bacterium]|nr:16S rRNA processing protein RimM [Ignavibacteriota bacterium]
MDLFAVGKIVGCFGVKGYVRVEAYTESPQRLKTLQKIFIGASTTNVITCLIQDIVLNKNSVLIKFDGVNDRTSVERIVGQMLFVEQCDLPILNEGTYFIHDIIGCEVITSEGFHLGRIDDVYKLPAHDLWAMRNRAKVYLIPAVKDFVKTVDVKHKRIVVQVIEGLIEE